MRCQGHCLQEACLMAPHAHHVPSPQILPAPSSPILPQLLCSHRVSVAVQKPRAQGFCVFLMECQAPRGTPRPCNLKSTGLADSCLGSWGPRSICHRQQEEQLWVAARTTREWLAARPSCPSVPFQWSLFLHVCAWSLTRPLCPPVLLHLATCLAAALVAML